MLYRKMKRKMIPERPKLQSRNIVWGDKLQGRSPMLGAAKFFQTYQVKENLNTHEQNLLKSTGFQYFLDIHRCKLSRAIIQALGQAWSKEEQGFQVGGVLITFTANAVALISGLPNRGELISPLSFSIKEKHKFQTSLFSSKSLYIAEVERKIVELLSVKERSGEDSRKLVQVIVWYILGGLIVVGTKRDHVADELAGYIYRLETISNYNWAAMIHATLVSSLNRISSIYDQRKMGLSTKGYGYIHGFAYCLQVSIIFLFTFFCYKDFK